MMTCDVGGWPYSDEVAFGISDGLLSPDGPSDIPGCITALMHPEEEPQQCCLQEGPLNNWSQQPFNWRPRVKKARAFSYSLEGAHSSVYSLYFPLIFL